MSLINLIASDKFISFMSDGRVVNTEVDEIISESYKKVFKVNDKIIYNVGGNYEAAKVLDQYINTFDMSNAKSFAHSMFNTIGKGVVHKEMHIFIGGLDEKGGIYYTGFSHNSMELIEIYPTYGTNRFACNESGVSDSAINFDKFEKLMNQNKRILRVKDAKMIQEKLNAQVSMIDNTVGTKTFHEYIRK